PPVYSPAPAHTDNSPLSLHDALPIWRRQCGAKKITTFQHTGPLFFGTSCSRSKDMSSGAVRSFQAWRFRFGRSNRTLQYLYAMLDRKSTRLNSSHVKISYAVFCLKKK